MTEGPAVAHGGQHSLGRHGQAGALLPHVQVGFQVHQQACSTAPGCSCWESSTRSAWPPSSMARASWLSFHGDNLNARLGKSAMYFAAISSRAAVRSGLWEISATTSWVVAPSFSRASWLLSSPAKRSSPPPGRRQPTPPPTPRPPRQGHGALPPVLPSIHKPPSFSCRNAPIITFPRANYKSGGPTRGKQKERSLFWGTTLFLPISGGAYTLWM